MYALGFGGSGEKVAARLVVFVVAGFVLLVLITAAVLHMRG